jgi:hypothetical protein
MSKYLSIACALLLTSTLFFAWLSWSLNADKAVLSAELSACAERNSTLVKDVEIAILSCKIEDAIATENTKGQAELDNKKEDVLKQIDSIPPKAVKEAKKPVPQQQAVQETRDETDVVDIDGRLPDALRLQLDRVYQQGNTGGV